MPTTTRLVLLQRLSELLGDWWSAATTGAGTTTTTVDSKLAQLSPDTDFCLEWFVRSVTPDEVRKVTGGYTPVGTTITHAAFTAAVGNTNTYELHRYDPTDKHIALSRAIEELYPVLYLPLRDETLFVDDLLVNSGYESALVASAHPSWTNNLGGGSTTRETTRVFHGASSAGVTTVLDAAAQIYQEPTINFKEVMGKTVRFWRWVYITAATRARIRLDWDGTNFANSSYHTGQDRWELLKVEAAIPTTATRIRAICEVASGSVITAYFDGPGGLIIDGIWRYTLPTSILTGPHYVLYQAYDAEPAGRYYPVVEKPPSARTLRLEGMGLLSRPTTDAGTVEVGPPQTNLILAKAAEIFWRIQASPARSAALSTGRFQQEIAYWRAEVERLKMQPGVPMRGMGAKIGKDSDGVIWHIDEDSSGRYLVFSR